ncbi:MAG: hypothetical protein KC912_01900 [Proteobacteria bacterium]|nr:hypothetical protein [Pseudomonadota bacterium]
MRTLTLIMALSSATLVGCTGGGDLEICDNGLDDDGDDLIDAADTADCPVEICDNEIDDDGDGAIDAADSDCTVPPEGDCADGVDGPDADGLIDCADDECAADAACLPAEIWAYEGSGTATATEYTGEWHMTDTISVAPNGNYNVGDVVCDVTYPHNSTGASTPTIACPSCEWAFDFAEEQPYSSDTGPLCASWYNFTDTEAQNYFGVMSTPASFGLTTQYQYSGGTYTVALFYYSGTYNGTTYTGWYPYGAATFESGTGATAWYRERGSYEY